MDANMGVEEGVKSDRRYRKSDLYPGLFKDNRLSVGGKVKETHSVLKEHSRRSTRAPNLTCRIETFGRICRSFDEQKKNWVMEMGFGGLLNIPSDLQLPRQLGYWLMTRIDPISKKFIGGDGTEFRFSKNQLHWVFGIPNGGKPVPTTKRIVTDEVRVASSQILSMYGKSWQSKSSRHVGRLYNSRGIPVDSNMLDKVEGHWGKDEEVQFKTLFLLLALHMVLCPTQASRLAAELIPALTCASECSSYDWCGLVLDNLMESVSSFASRFYGTGFAAGCGGCIIFVVIFYLDRLNRDPVEWGVFPRIMVWDMTSIRNVARQDRVTDGDFGFIGMLDVAYGEHHPREARDTKGPQVVFQSGGSIQIASGVRKRRRARSEKNPFIRKMPKTESEICISNLTPLYVGQCSSVAFPSEVIVHLSNGHNGTGGAPHNLVGVCEVNVFFINNGQLNVRIHSSHCSAVFISLKRNEIVVLGSGCTYTNFEDLMRMVAHLQSSIKDHVNCPTTGSCWRVRQVSNIPILQRVK